MANTKITSANLDTNIAIAGTLGVTGNITGTLATAAQPNITSVGTLTSFRSTGIDDNADATAITIDSSERVGIGKTPSTWFLDVDSSSTNVASFDGSNNTGVVINSSSSIADIIGYSNSASSYNALNIRGASGTGLVVDTSNRVGIGETSPEGTLHIKGGASGSSYTADGADKLIIEHSDSVAIDLRTPASNQALIMFSDGTRSQGLIGYNHSDDSMRFSNSGNAERMRIDSSGNVGIGTTSPNTKLHIEGGFVVRSSSSSVFNDSNNAENVRMLDAGITFNADAIDKDFTIKSDNNAAMFHVDAGNDRVGIGTTSPSKLLHIQSDTNYEGIQIKGAGHKQLTIESTQSSKQALVTFTTNSQNMSIGLETDNAFIFHSGTAGSERMRITSAGKFVVGDTSALNGGGALGSFVFSGSQGVFISTVAQSTGEVMGFVHQKTSVVGTIAINSSSTTYNTSSDARLKDVTGEARGLEVINALNPVSYNWKVDGKEDEGLIAQECEDIVPNAITKNSSDYYGMDYSKLVVHLVKGMQEQQTIIEDLKSRIKTLEG